MPPRAKKVKADPEPSHPAAVLARGAQLTGVLARLPVETLVDILVRCTPRAIVNLLATCQALRSIASHSETFIYRALYHGLLAGRRPAPVGSHVIYSPVLFKKGETRREYVMSEPLPGDAVYSWKVQYITAFSWYNSRSSRKCMHCRVDQKSAVHLEEPAWRMRLCLLCFAKNLVNKSSLKAYSLTAGDVVGLIEVTLDTIGGLGNRTTGKFYSAQQLVQLATQKHGDKYKGPRPIGLFEKEERESRENLVGTATLLHGGLYWDTEFVMERYRPRDQSIDYGHFATEFNHYIKRESYKKNKKASVPHPYGHTWSHDLVKRPIEEILADYTSLVPEHGDDFPCIDGRPLFRPAASPGPLLPTETSIEAYRTLDAAAKKHYLGPLLRDDTEVSTIRALQAYLLSPGDPTFTFAMDRLREEFFLHRRFTQIPRYQPLPALMDVKSFADSYRYGQDPDSDAADPDLPVVATRIGIVARVAPMLGLDFTTWDVVYDELGSVYVPPHSGPWLAMYLEDGELSGLLWEAYVAAREGKQALSSSILHNLPNLTLLMQDAYEVTRCTKLLRLTKVLPTFAGEKFSSEQQGGKKMSVREELRGTFTEELRKEMEIIMRLFRDGMISVSALNATVMRVGMISCPSHALAHPTICTDNCWQLSLIEEQHQRQRRAEREHYGDSEGGHYDDF